MSDPGAAESVPEPDLRALFEEAQRKAAEDKAEREREEAAQSAVLYERIDRLVGTRSWKTGDKSGVLCPACRQSYVFDQHMRQVHPGDCPGYRVRDVPTRNGAYGDDD